MILGGGKMILAGGEIILAGGEIIFTGGEIILRGGEIILTGGKYKKRSRREILFIINLVSSNSSFFVFLFCQH